MFKGESFKMRQLFWVMLVCVSGWLSAPVHGASALAVIIAETVAEYAIPAIAKHCCQGDSQDNVQARVGLNTAIDKPALQDHFMQFNLNHCKVNIVQMSGANSDSNFASNNTLIPWEPLVIPNDNAFQQELLVLISKNIEMIDLEMGETIHALIFKDTDGKINLPIKGAARKLHEKAFDFLFGDTLPASDAEKTQRKKEQKLLHKFIKTLNKALHKDKNNHENGLFLCASGRKFYRLGTTYFFPLRKDEFPPNWSLVPHEDQKE
jgi:hypothetical protein